MVGTSAKLPISNSTARPKTTNLWFNDQFSTPRYQLASFPPSSFSGFGAFPRLKSESANIGTTVTATINEAKSAKTTVKANGRNSSPTNPVTNPSGRKTAIVTIVDEATGMKTSRVASMMSALPFNGSAGSVNRR